jgi:DNA-binding transcriptional MocR family regulator
MGVHSARLNFASSSLAEIAEGIQILAGLLTERMAAGGAFA